MTNAAQDSRYQYLTSSERRHLKRWNIDEATKHTHFVPTYDGWQLALTHTPANPNTSKHQDPRRRLPILLCHGLGSNRIAFEVGPHGAFSQFLADQGFDVYAADLRGHGLSQKPGYAPTLRYGWGMEEYGQQDLPALVDTVLRLSGAPRLHFIGHSMGGILLYCRAALGDIRIQSGIAIGSSLDYSDTDTVFRFVAPLAPIGKLLPSVPIHWLARTSGTLSRVLPKAVDPVLANPANVELIDFQRLTATATHAVSAQVLRDLATAIDGRGLRSRKGIHFAERLRANAYPFPILAISGTQDLQCPPEAANRFGTHQQVFGLSAGHKVDYGHHDLIMGRHANSDVWPCVLDWLNTRDAF